MDLPTENISVTRHRDATGWWESVSSRPDPRLRDIVLDTYQGWTEQTTALVRRREVPRLMVPVILNLGAPWGVATPGNEQRRLLRFDSFAAGLHDGFAVTESTGLSQCLQVNLTPLGAYRVFGLAMDALTNRAVAVEDVLGADGDALITRLREAPDWPARFALLDRFLLRRAARTRAPSPEVAWALGRLHATAGAMPIGQIATATGWSRKRLIAQFRAQLGLPPKSVARILRFDRALPLLRTDDAIDWAALAQDCGYYDQAHFNRDFREFAGCTPGAYHAAQLPVAQGGVLVAL